MSFGESTRKKKSELRGLASATADRKRISLLRYGNYMNDFSESVIYDGQIVRHNYYFKSLFVAITTL